MSPEQAKGLKTIDHRTDVWSLGAVLYETLTGHSPHHKADTLGQLILAICSEPVTPVQDLAPWVDAETARIVHRALTIPVEQRFGSAAEMIAAIRARLPSHGTLSDAILIGVSDRDKASVAERLALAETTAASATPAVSAKSGGDETVSTAAGVSTTSGTSASRGGARLAVVAGTIAVLAAGVAVWKLGPSSRSPSESLSRTPESLPSAASVAPAASTAPPSITPVAPSAEASAAGSASSDKSPPSKLARGAPPAAKPTAPPTPAPPVAPPPKSKGELDRTFE
jgi:serine/threonine-protein kinase